MSKEHSQGHAADPGRLLSHVQTGCKAHVNTGMAYARRKKLPGGSRFKKRNGCKQSRIWWGCGSKAFNWSLGWLAGGRPDHEGEGYLCRNLICTDPGKGAEELMTAAKPHLLHQK